MVNQSTAEEFNQSESARIPSLEEALGYYHEAAWEEHEAYDQLNLRFMEYKQEKEAQLAAQDSKLRALEDKEKLLESTLQQRDQRISDLLQALELKEAETRDLHTQLGQHMKEVSRIKSVSEHMMADSNRRWSQRCDLREEEMAAKQEAVCKSHQEEMAKMTGEISTLKKALEDQKMDMAASLAKWEERWVEREREVATEMAALHQENEKKLLMKDMKDPATRTLHEKVLLKQKLRVREARIEELRAQLEEKDADWQRKCHCVVAELRLAVEEKHQVARRCARLIRAIMRGEMIE